MNHRNCRDLFKSSVPRHTSPRKPKSRGSHEICDLTTQSSRPKSSSLPNLIWINRSRRLLHQETGTFWHPTCPYVANIARSIPTSCDLVDSPVNFAPGKKGSSQPKSPMWAVNFKPNNPDAWKPPDEWDCTPTEPRSAATRLEDLMNEMLSAALTDEVPEDTVDLSALQKEVRRMAAASPQAILSRLEAIWDTTLNPSLHQELEMEKKRWMLSTLHHLDPVPDLDVSQLRLGDGSSKVRRILALYESKGT